LNPVKAQDDPILDLSALARQSGCYVNEWYDEVRPLVRIIAGRLINPGTTQQELTQSQLTVFGIGQQLETINTPQCVLDIQRGFIFATNVGISEGGRETGIFLMGFAQGVLAERAIQNEWTIFDDESQQFGD